MKGFMLVPFEDAELMVSQRYHEILVQIYSDDYMTPRKAVDEEFEIHDIVRNSL